MSNAIMKGSSLYSGIARELEAIKAGDRQCLPSEYVGKGVLPRSLWYTRRAKATERCAVLSISLGRFRPEGLYHRAEWVETPPHTPAESLGWPMLRGRNGSH
jgi:hypothetical protein